MRHLGRSGGALRWVLGVALAAAAVAVVVVQAGGDDRSPRPEGDPGGAPRTRYVSTDGSAGADGTAEDPYGTLERGLESLRPGDVLVVAGGEYEERLDDVDIRPGTADAPIRVMAAESERPVLRGLLWLEEPSYWTVDGLNVTWDDRNDRDEHMVKLSGGRDWVFTDAELWGARSFAALLVADEPENFTLRRLHVHDTARANGTNQDHLIYLNSGTGGGVVEGCLLVGSPNGRAVKVGPADDDEGPVANIVLRYNTMVRNLGPSNVQLAYDTSNVRIERNVMVEAADGRPSVTTFELSGTGNVVVDNVVFGSTGALRPEDGLVDGGGNRRLDPMLEGADQVPGNAEAKGYGHTAFRPRSSSSSDP